MTHMKRIHIHLTESQIKALHAISEKNGLGIPELIRRAIDAYVQQQKQRSAR